MMTNPLKRAVARACSDAEYRGQLLSDPRAALAKAGVSVPEDIEVRVHEGTGSSLVIVLPASTDVDLGDSGCRQPIGAVANVPAGLTLEWKESPIAHVSTLVAAGRVDSSTAGTLRRELERSLLDVNLDLSGITFISSAGIGALIAAQQRLKGQDCCLRLVLVPDTVHNVFEASGVAELFEIHDLAEYVHFFPKGASVLFGGVGPTSPPASQASP
jgi:anti-sigma B factor antagonist